jgi:meiotically up-regulated gene 157 (Mug157) protein
MRRPSDNAILKHVADEIAKCKDNPYYFATNYMIVSGKPFTTSLTEHQFNLIVKSLSTRTREQNIITVPHGAGKSKNP